MKDCSKGEDELECEDFQCPGFYRCRGSTICLHPDHLCDGIKQCPLHEDEYTCNIQCPTGCTCLGLEFICTETFNTKNYTSLKYLDGTKSGFKLFQLQHVSSLVFLKLTFCNLQNIVYSKRLSFNSLFHLDVSHNDIQFIDTQFFDSLKALQVLRIGWNPIQMSQLSFLLKKFHLNIITLDISGLNVSKEWLSKFLETSNTNLQTLNLSHISLTQLPPFGKLSSLRVLDLRGNAIQVLPKDVFTGLNKLSELYSDNPKLCCPQLLPDHPKDCFTIPDEISSCENLLRSNIYRIFTWLFSLVSILGNASSFVSRSLGYSKSNRKTGFSLLVLNLCLSDLLMGVYLAIIGVADQMFDGSYLWKDIQWRRSIPCTVRVLLKYRFSFYLE